VVVTVRWHAGVQTRFAGGFPFSTLAKLKRSGWPTQVHPKQLPQDAAASKPALRVGELQF
jgi:hypothetical protein